jgi:hypothetical protein
MKSNSRLLLLCYEFPPYPSIGGRRWAKFAKYLARLGYKVQVIAAKYPLPQQANSNWQKDIENPFIQVHYLDSHYPYNVFQRSNSFLNRLSRKLYTKFLEYKGKGIVQDKAFFWENDVLHLAKALILEHNIINVISTGPPHRLNYYAARLKEIFPHLHVTCDFRDTWLDGKVYGIPPLADRVLKAEARMEQYTVQNADFLLFTYQPMLADFAHRYPGEKKKLIHFPHNFDFEDYPNERKVSDKTNSKISFIYGGTITSSAVRDAFIPFLDALKEIKQRNFPLYKMLKVVFYGDHSILKREIREKGVSDIVKMEDQIPEEDFYREAANSSFLLSFLGNDWKDLITTKNISYLPFQKPVLLISKRGLAQEFIEKNKFGYVIDPTNVFKDLCSILEENRNFSFQKRSSLRMDEYSYENATKRLLAILK